MLGNLSRLSAAKALRIINMKFSARFNDHPKGIVKTKMEITFKWKVNDMV